MNQTNVNNNQMNNDQTNMNQYNNNNNNYNNYDNNNNYNNNLYNNNMNNDQMQQQQMMHMQQQQMQVQQQEEYLLGQFNDILNKIESSTEYIKNTRDWIMNNCLNSMVFVNFMTKKVLEFSPDQRLYLLFLINDILHFSQFSRSENKPEYFIQQFYQNLPSILSNTFYIINTPMREQVVNILNLWIERSVYSKQEVEELKKYLKRVPPSNVTLMPGTVISHIRLAQDVTLPIDPQDIDYYHLYNFDRSENNINLYSSIDQFYKTIYNNNNNNNNNNINQTQ